MNHFISGLLPPKQSFADIAISDPVTGQAAWYDLCVKITPELEGETSVWPQFEKVQPFANREPPPKEISYEAHENADL